ncbi:MAG: acetate--CoA ligase family protein [Candidatus Riflebacteria bacterium]|nr:acetate--CoA ligase family protein [Candidatus Riflebacteria bacterium]
MVSVGNSAQQGVEEVLADQASRGEGRTKLLYFETIKQPALLLDAARRLSTCGCSIVALKTGTTEAGSRAASSHTGAMASSDAAVTALFDKAGIVRVRSKTEMVDVAGVLNQYGPPRGSKVVIVTHAGGPGVSLTDELSRQGFEVPELRAGTQARLRERLLPGSAFKNPVDLLAAGTAQHLADVLSILKEEERDMGAVAIIFGSPGLFDVWPAYQVILQNLHSYPVPIYPILTSPIVAADAVRRFKETGSFYFTDEVHLATALGRIAKTPPAAPAAPRLPPIDEAAVETVLGEARKRGGGQLAPGEIGRVLRACGFRMPETLEVDGVDEASRAAARIGFPVVLKVVGLVHKSDRGGVLVDLRTDQEVRDGFARLRAIPGATGVTVQRQVSGLELILGVSREERFGHLVLFGLGGIFTEVLGDVAMALAPLSDQEAMRLVGSIRSASMLEGRRGRPGVDRAVVADGLVRLSTLVHRFPQIKELDINPLMGHGADLVVVDCRIDVD